jgi:hypothetical protein|tara:strand:+ start:152 stop:580 length:429 start_codon:yes stop_codon:yes gene_type:complete
MSFYTFDFSSLPIIKIKLEGRVTLEKVDGFLNKWLEIYDLDTKHTLIFDMTKTHSPTIKSAIKLAKFIKKVKMEKPQLLERSFLIINENSLLRYLFGMVFTITRPIAPIFVYWKKPIETHINPDTILNVFHTNALKFQYIRQ